VASARSKSLREAKTLSFHGLASASGTTILGLPTCFCRSAIMSQISMMARWPAMMASASTSSDSSMAPASTMVTASRVPETTRSSDDWAICSVVGLTTSWSSTRPMRTVAPGPW
jgi:hypothetical protein